MFLWRKPSKPLKNDSILLFLLFKSGSVRPTWKKTSSSDWTRGLPPACWRVLVHLLRKLSSKCLLHWAERLSSERIRVGIAYFSARTETSAASCGTSLSRYLCVSAPSKTTALLLFRWTTCIRVFKVYKIKTGFKKEIDGTSQKASLAISKKKIKKSCCCESKSKLNMCSFRMWSSSLLFIFPIPWTVAGP